MLKINFWHFKFTAGASVPQIMPQSFGRELSWKTIYFSDGVLWTKSFRKFSVPQIINGRFLSHTKPISLLLYVPSKRRALYPKMPLVLRRKLSNVKEKLISQILFMCFLHQMGPTLLHNFFSQQFYLTYVKIIERSNRFYHNTSNEVDLFYIFNIGKTFQLCVLLRPVRPVRIYLFARHLG